MQRESNKHHFVPRSLLKYFSVDGLGVQVHVLDKHSGKSFTPSIENTASENGFNKAKIEGDVWNFEYLFNDVDAQLNEQLEKIHRSRSSTALSLKDRCNWADMVAVQLVRTPIIRSTLIQSAHDLVNTMAESGLANVDAWVFPTDNDSRLSTVELLLKRGNFREALEDKDFVLFEPADSARFVISDHPVIRQTLVPYGNSGLRSPGVAVYLPLGPDLLLGMMCKSVGVSLNTRQIERLDIGPASAQEIASLGEALRTGNPIRCSNAFVDYMNQSQVANCARFVYSHKNDFRFVQEFLKKHPEFKKVKTQIRVGRIGEGLPEAPRMPEGQWLVLFGARNHYMIKIFGWSAESDPILVSTEQVEELERALFDSPFSEMQIYEDRQAKCMMRDVCVDILSKDTSVQLRIRYTDPSMDALNEMIMRGHR